MSSTARVSNLNAANLLTLLRILLVPVFLILCLYAYRGPEDAAVRLYHHMAQAVFVCIVTTDFLDGHIARRRGLKTPFGALLDPLADKLFISTSFVVLTAFEQIPAWLAISVVAKDLLLVLGWGIMFILGVTIGVSASKIGKICAVAQYATVCAAILRLPAVFSQWVLWPATAVLTVVTFVGYALDALEQVNRRSDA